MRFQDVFDRVAEGAVAAGVGSDVVGFLLHFGAGVFHGDGQACGAHGGEVDYVVADEGGFFRLETFLPHDFFEASTLVLDALMNVLEFQVAGAERDGFGDALGDESGLDAGEAGKGDRGAVVGVEAFGFDQGLAVEAESALAAVLGGPRLRLGVEDALSCAGWGGEDEEFAVGEDAVDVEEQEFDFAGAGLRRRVWASVKILAARPNQILVAGD